MVTYFNNLINRVKNFIIYKYCSYPSFFNQLVSFYII